MDDRIAQELVRTLKKIHKELEKQNKLKELELKRDLNK